MAKRDMADLFAYNDRAVNKKGKLRLGKKTSGNRTFSPVTTNEGLDTKIKGQQLYKSKGSAYVWSEDKDGLMRRVRGTAGSGPGKYKRPQRKGWR